MNVVIYARYSSHNQTEQSIEGQIAVCEEYAKRNDYTIVGTYIDRAMSGTNDNRQQFQQMIKDSSKGLFNGVLVYQLDRFARNRLDSLTYKAILKENDVRVFSAKENITDDASGVLVESVLEGMAEYYSLELSQKVKRGMRISAEKCLYTGGVVPLGYKIDSNNKYQIDKENAVIIKTIFEMYADGQTMESIADYLNNKNIKTVYGKSFRKNSIATILANEKYIGTYKYIDIIIPNGIPAIISKELFKKVQSKLNFNKKSPASKRANVDFILTTKLFCGTCKEMLTGTSGTSRTGTVHYYYTCNGRKKHNCKRKNLHKEYIEDLVLKETKSILTDDIIDKIAENCYKILKQGKNNSTLRLLEKNLKEIEKQKNNLLDSLKICDIDSVKKTIFEEIAKVNIEYENMQKEIIKEKNNHFDFNVNDIKFFLYSLKNADTNDMEFKKLIVNVLIDKIFIYDDELIIYCNISNNNEIKVKLPNINYSNGSSMVQNGEP